MGRPNTHHSVQSVLSQGKGGERLSEQRDPGMDGGGGVGPYSIGCRGRYNTVTHTSYSVIQ